MQAEPYAAGRALDALIAEQVMGLQVVARDWPCGYVPGGEYEASPWPEGRASWYTDRGPICVHDGDLWPPEDLCDDDNPGLIAKVTPVPFYSTDIAAAWQVVEHMIALVEQDIYGLGDRERRLRWVGPIYKPRDQYLTQEGYPLGTTCWDVQVDAFGWHLHICADTAPLAICRAALAVQSAEAMRAAAR